VLPERKEHWKKKETEEIPGKTVFDKKEEKK